MIAAVDVEAWLRARQVWRPDAPPQNATQAGRRFYCDTISGALTGTDCAQRHQAARPGCATCAHGQARAQHLGLVAIGSVPGRGRLVVLSDRFLSTLGRIPDPALAARAGVSRSVVRRARMDLGIADHKGPWRAYSRGEYAWASVDFADSELLLARRMWCTVTTVRRGRRSISAPPSKWDRAELGLQPDAVVAARLGLEEADVGRYRERCGVPAPAERGRVRARCFVDWDRVELLGQVTDAELAAELHVPPAIVAGARRERGLPAVVPPRATRIDWDRVELGVRTDAILAQELGCARSSVTAARNQRGIPSPDRWRPVRDATDWDAVQLGQRPDLVIAEQLGVAQSTVAAARADRGITRWTETGIDWDAQPFGLELDKDLAARLGVHKATVLKERHRRGIARAPRPRALEQLEVTAPDLHRWILHRSDPAAAASAVMRVLKGRHGALEDVVAELGQRWTSAGMARLVDRKGLDGPGIKWLVQVAQQRGQLTVCGPDRQRRYVLAGAEPVPFSNTRPAGLTVGAMLSVVPCAELDNGLVRFLTGWGRKATRNWLCRQVDAGHLVRVGRTAATWYHPPRAMELAA